jgi:hypothetical protein
MIRSIIVILFILFSSCTKSQEKITLTVGRPTESVAQGVTNRYAEIAALTTDQTNAVKTAIQSIEEAGIYDKLLALNIPAFRVNGRILNVVAPVEYDGAFALTTSAGSPSYGSSGVTLSSSSDKLSTHFANDLAANAPNMGVFWYSSVGLSSAIVTSTSPFNIEPRFGGKAYVSIWASSSGVNVPTPPAGFSMGQRSNSTTVDFFQGTTRYSVTSSLNSANPTGHPVLIQGGADVFILKIFGITEALTDSEEAALKNIIDQLVIDLGL